jgi:hypothetical protein
MATALVAAAATPQQSAARPQTTAPPPVIDIKVTITDSRIDLSRKHAFRGDYARFILHNTGKQPHAFAFGGGKRGTGVQTGFHKLLKPSEVTILLLFLDYRGRVSYGGTLAADRAKPGMTGTFNIG